MCSVNCSKGCKTESAFTSTQNCPFSELSNFKDTIVRWSAAKGAARVAERLPAYFADQVLDTITGLFSIHSLAAASLYDLPAVAESTWHGACLASAEMARRGLVTVDKLADLIEWLSKVS